MIFLIAGTNGAGKTTAVRRILESLSTPIETTDLYTVHEDRNGQHWAILGTYSGSACGGCDKFSWKGAANDLENTLVALAEHDTHAILEGSIVSTWGRDRLARLIPYGLQVLQLDTPVEECERRVNARRLEKKGPEKYTPVNPKNLISKYEGLLSILPKRRDLGIPVDILSQDDAVARVTNLMGGRPVDPDWGWGRETTLMGDAHVAEDE